MAKTRPTSRLVLVDDPSSCFASGTGGARIVVLKHPKLGVDFQYMLVGQHLCEIQRISQPTPCSWFVDQTTHSDGSLLLASRIDPAFMLLPLLEASSRCFSPKAQYLGTASAELRSLDGVDATLAALCDVNPAVEDDGGDASLYRLNTEKAVLFFSTKARRLGAMLQEQAQQNQQRMRAQLGSFASKSESVAEGSSSSSASPPAADAAAPASSGAAREGSSSPSEAGQQAAASSSSPSSCSNSVGAVGAQHMAMAIGILSEYLKDQWTEALAVACSVPLASVLPALAKARAAAAAADRRAASGGDDDDDQLPQGYDLDDQLAGAAADGGDAAAPADGAAKWNAAALEDPAALVSKYVRPPSTGKGGDQAKKAAPTLTPQQKKLAATSTKGMKSMTSFFGKK